MTAADNFSMERGEPLPPTIAPAVGSAAEFIPVVDMTTDSLDVVHQAISHAAITTGLVFVKHLPMRPDFASVKRLFDQLYQNPPLAARLVGGFNRGGRWTGDDAVDDKASLRFNSQVLRSIQNTPLPRVLGPDFERTISFFEAVQTQLVPVILGATSDAIATSSGELNSELWDVHSEGNVNFRLIDYHRPPSSTRQGAREHRDAGTATIIFQDGSGGLEIQNPTTNTWHTVPPYETVVMWGRAGHLFSGGRIRAVNHRVRDIPTARRNVAVCFVAPDLDAPLQPIVASRDIFPPQIMNGDFSVRDFRETIKARRGRQTGQRMGIMRGGQGGAGRGGHNAEHGGPESSGRGTHTGQRGHAGGWQQGNGMRGAWARVGSMGGRGHWGRGGHHHMSGSDPVGSWSGQNMWGGVSDVQRN
jgi:2OG-Fe(II) oxygenase superfamily